MVLSSLNEAMSNDEEWLNIVYSGFWDYPFAFVVRFKMSTYLFVRGDFDEEVHDYPSEFEVFVTNDIDIDKLEKNFPIEESGEAIGRVDRKEIEFDPTHRERIDSRVFRRIHNE